VWVSWKAASNAISAAGASVAGLGSVGAFSAPERTGIGDFGDIAISPTGAVLVTYERSYTNANPSTLYSALDPDGLGPAGFNAESTVTNTNVGGFYPIPAQNSRTVDAEAGLAWDRSGGAHNGRVYFVYTDAPSSGSADTNIFVRFSDNNGGTWSAPIQANDDSTGNSQFLPRIALDQTTGQLALSWYDARNSSGNNTAQVWATTSTDGTTFTANVQVSAGTSNAAPAASIIDFGDYTGLAYQEGSFYPFWSDNSNSTGDNPNGAGSSLDMYTAAVVVARRATQLTYTGSTTATVHQPATLSASLTDAGTGSPLPGQTITLALGSQACTATTDATGVGSCDVTVTQASGATTATANFAGTAQYAPSTASVPASISPAPSHVTYTGLTTSDFHDAFTASATLTEVASGSPVSGATIAFSLGSGLAGETWTAVTDSSGAASCPLTPAEAAGPTTLTASFAGDAFTAASSATVPFTITKEETTLTYTGPTVFPNANTVTFSAVLDEDGTTPIPGRTVSISIGSGAAAQTCTGTTDATGTASCTTAVNQPLGPGLPISATFAGDAFYLSSSASATGLVFAFLDHGTFAVGDGSAATNSSALFWGAQWAKSNALSGGSAPSSFKGFAGTTSTKPPSCGGSYTGSPGDSSAPPASLPSYLGVAVSSSVTQSGSTMSGNVAHIVVVKTDPGYAANPGHAGTGTVVAQFC
jgi:hypothetical protein